MPRSLLVFLFIVFYYSGVSQTIDMPTLSPFSEISQEIGLTEIKLSYSRPSAKGRVIFGDLVPYGVTWRTGANASTKITFTEDVKIDGMDLPSGTYAIYTIPDKKEWTIIIHKKTDMRSIAGDRVKKENDAFRFKVTPQYNPVKVETFTIQFSDLTTNTCNVQLSWENTTVKIPVEVEVNVKIDDQIGDLMKDPENVSHRVYFRIAEYNLHNGRDLDESLKWINEAIARSEKNYRYGLLKSKIFSARGEKAMAIATVKEAHQWAVDAGNANYEEQTRLYLKSIEGN